MVAKIYSIPGIYRSINAKKLGYRRLAKRYTAANNVVVGGIPSHVDAPISRILEKADSAKHQQSESNTDSTISNDESESNNISKRIIADDGTQKTTTIENGRASNTDDHQTLGALGTKSNYVTSSNDGDSNSDNNDAKGTSKRATSEENHSAKESVTSSSNQPITSTATEKSTTAAEKSITSTSSTATSSAVESSSTGASSSAVESSSTGASSSAVESSSTGASSSAESITTTASSTTSSMAPVPSSTTVAPINTSSSEPTTTTTVSTTTTTILSTSTSSSLISSSTTSTTSITVTTTTSSIIPSSSSTTMSSSTVPSSIVNSSSIPSVTSSTSSGTSSAQATSFTELPINNDDSSTNKNAIVGGVLGAICGAAMLFSLFFILFKKTRRSKNQKQKSADEMYEYTPAASVTSAGAAVGARAFVPPANRNPSTYNRNDYPTIAIIGDTYPYHPTTTNGYVHPENGEFYVDSNHLENEPYYYYTQGYTDSSSVTDITGAAGGGASEIPLVYDNDKLSDTSSKIFLDPEENTDPGLVYKKPDTKEVS